jgi:hypothetical protein
MRISWTFALMLTGAAAAGVVDRVAVVVGTHVITESEVVREVRMTELTAGEPLDLSLEQRKAAADRLVDQQLIRTEMELGNYPVPTAAEVNDMLRKWRQEHFSSIPQYRAALEKYGIGEDELKQHLAWQLAALRFTDQRFHVGLGPASTDGQSADRSTGPSLDDQMDAWLQNQRANTRIQFKKGAFAQ